MSPTDSITTPWVIDCNTLENLLKAQPDNERLLVVDMTKQEDYLQGHIPGAVFLDYAKIVKHKPPVVGMLPDTDQFSQALSEIGATPDTYIVVYDDEGGGKAARLMWTLEVAGHKKMSLLDGGIHAWLRDIKTVNSDIPTVKKSQYPVNFANTAPVADAEYIMANLTNDNCRILDTRSKNEFTGADKRAARAGHIPGAINLDWMDIKNADDAQKLKSPEQLKNMLSKLKLTPELEIITHCHSHHRSALTYVALKFLGYHNVKGYPASWSDWAERSDTPVEM